VLNVPKSGYLDGMKGLKSTVAKTSILLLSATIIFPALDASFATAKPTVGQKYVFQFNAQKATLTTSSSVAFGRVIADLKLVKSVRITAYAPTVGPLSRQRALVNSRVTTIANKLKLAKIDATVLRSTTLVRATDRVRQNQAVIQVVSLKPVVVPSTSPSPKPTATSSPSVSPSSTPTPTFAISGKITLETVDVGCGGEEKQLQFDSVSLLPESSASPIAQKSLLPSDSVYDFTSNMSNCSLNWNFADVPAGKYTVQFKITCAEMTDAVYSPAQVCTPTWYVQYGTLAKASGVGPTQNGLVSEMRFDLPIVVSGPGELSTSKFYLGL